MLICVAFEKKNKKKKIQAKKNSKIAHRVMITIIDQKTKLVKSVPTNSLTPDLIYRNFSTSNSNDNTAQVHSCTILRHLLDNYFYIDGVATFDAQGNLLSTTATSPPSSHHQLQPLLYCCNYVIVPFENFIRIDTDLTLVSPEEVDTGKEHLNSTYIKSGHKGISDDLLCVECAGEIRLQEVSAASIKPLLQPSLVSNGNKRIFELKSVNVQTSQFEFPSEQCLKESWQRFQQDGLKLYRTNAWEQKGRNSKLQRLQQEQANSNSSKNNSSKL